MIVTDLMFMSIIRVMRMDATWGEEVLFPWVMKVSIFRVVLITNRRWRRKVVFRVVDTVMVYYVFIPFFRMLIGCNVSVWVTMVEMFDWVVCVQVIVWIVRVRMTTYRNMNVVVRSVIKLICVSISVMYLLMFFVRIRRWVVGRVGWWIMLVRTVLVYRVFVMINITICVVIRSWVICVMTFLACFPCLVMVIVSGVVFMCHFPLVLWLIMLCWMIMCYLVVMNLVLCFCWRMPFLMINQLMTRLMLFSWCRFFTRFFSFLVLFFFMIFFFGIFMVNGEIDMMVVMVMCFMRRFPWGFSRSFLFTRWIIRFQTRLI